MKMMMKYHRNLRVPSPGWFETTTQISSDGSWAKFYDKKLLHSGMEGALWSSVESINFV